MKPYSEHWADIAAAKIVRERSPLKGDGEPYVCASGITPSGTVHIGNFREIISVELVVRGLRQLGVPVRFLYSWDDYDVFRKVPANAPKPELLKDYLRQPITRVPDVWTGQGNYARHHEMELESVLPLLGIEPEYIYQAGRYQDSVYAEGIQRALRHRETIRVELDAHRSSPLPADWWPISIFCGTCFRDETQCLDWDGDWTVEYECGHCSAREKIDLRHTGLAKLPWRIDWPMRWAYEKVDFEPAGKDHHSEGGSFTTAQLTSEEVYGYPPPVTFQYDFVRIKGGVGKISSSSGEVIGLSDVLEVYEAEVLRYMFASTKPNREFAISFDCDVLKIYEDYDRCEAVYYEPPREGRAAAKQASLRRIYELSQVAEIPSEQPYTLPFRHFCNLLQIHEGDLSAVERFLTAAGTPVPEHSRGRFEARGRCAWNWICHYAPEEMKFQLRRTGEPPGFEPSSAFEAFLPGLRQLVEAGWNESESREFSGKIYALMESCSTSGAEIFPQIYRLLIGRPEGPRLVPFLYAIGRERLLELLHL